MEMQELHTSALEKHEKAKQLVNHYTRSSNWDEMRRSRFHGTPLHVATGEYIPLQHGSPDLKRNYIYPSQPSPIPAFQMPGQYSPKYIPLQDLRPGPQMSPLSVRTAKTQDFMNQDPDEAVIKISSMFPTVSDTHIRLLLKNALQVEKHPIVTPGPFATPPPTRSIHIPLQMTPPLGVRTMSRTSSPTLRTTSTNSTYTGSPRVGDYRNSPRPHSSPKLKLRYMKSLFPQAEETIILDVLTSNDNNIQKASDTLKEMGFSKKDSAKLKKIADEAKKVAEEKAKKEAEMAFPKTPLAPPKLKTLAEKDKIKLSLQQLYKDIPEHVISIALESVHFDEDRANQILQIMVQEDNKMDNKIKESLDIKEEEKCEVDCLSPPVMVTTSQSRQSLKSLLKEKPECNKTTFSRVIEENNMNSGNYKSSNLSNTKGSNPSYVNGANEKLLLEDYIKWQGPNAKLKHGANLSIVKGPNKDLVGKKNYKPCGPNAELRKGALLGLAKGSIFSQLKVAFMGESRGK
ncbi:uncharacterized protein [Atheta coriaria]|uniref:uncharacterized protein isoform X2 n=1 Tax=Dalotia coriaria TaxID=877792 RepID=UPI0031F4022F